MNPLTRSDVNSLWGAFLAEALVRLGMRHVVVSPGSRSTPITWAVGHCEGLETIVALDERAAAFYALGLARSYGRSVALVCTSGSAGANYLPALVEAYESGVPLLVLTADRPPELRRCAAGQAIEQTRLYGAFVQDYFELPLPEPTQMGLRQLRQMLRQALRRTLFPSAGPVQVNCPLREPLAPQSGKGLKLTFDPDTLLGSMAPERGEAALPDFDPLPLPRRVQRGLIVAGSSLLVSDSKGRDSLWSLAARTGWPVLCDVLGPWRAGEVPEGVVRISTYEAILQNESRYKLVEPDFVLQVGPLPTSKALRQWLAKGDAQTLIASTGVENLDPLHRRSFSVQLPAELLHLLPLPRADKGKAYAKDWAEAEGKERARLNVDLYAKKERAGLSAELVVREVFRTLPEHARLCVANSLSVRHAELYAELGHAPFRVFFSRGANGIDGTVATALGVAHGGLGYLLTGDLALLHDAGALLLGAELKGALTIVLLDNGGGGIFRKLPVGELPDPAFERYFLTPQRVDFQALATAYGVDYVPVGDLAQLSLELLREDGARLRLLHVRVP